MRRYWTLYNELTIDTFSWLVLICARHCNDMTTSTLLNNHACLWSCDRRWASICTFYHTLCCLFKLDMFPGTWGCPRHVRFACHTSSMHIQSTKAKSKHQKQQYLFLISSKFIIISKFNIYTVHLKCFDSIRYHLNEYKTLTKNFNQGLNSGELVWKMAKSKHQKQH